MAGQTFFLHTQEARPGSSTLGSHTAPKPHNIPLHTSGGIGGAAVKWIPGLSSTQNSTSSRFRKVIRIRLELSISSFLWAGHR